MFCLHSLVVLVLFFIAKRISAFLTCHVHFSLRLKKTGATIIAATQAQPLEGNKRTIPHYNTFILLAGKLPGEGTFLF